MWLRVPFLLALAIVLSVSFSVWLVLAFPGWMLLLSLFLLQRARQIPGTAPIDLQNPARGHAEAS